MTAKGKINASNVQVNDRIIVNLDTRVYQDDTCFPSSTKTGDGVVIARVIDKTYTPGQSRRPGLYTVFTTAGTFQAAPIQTMWLAPEDNAGIKRAHVEALAENEARQTAEEFTPAERAELAQAVRDSGLMDDLHVEALAEDAERRQVSEKPLTTPATEAEKAFVARTLRTLEFNPEAGASAPEANRHASQTMGVTGLTLNSQAGKVDNMNNDADRFTLTERQINENAAQSEAENLAEAEEAREENEAPGGIYGPENHTGSTVVSLLEKVWARIRADHPELPEVVIITGSGLVGASKWGHFRAEGWKVREEGAAIRKHELFLAGEALAKGARQVLQTMLHEGAHTLAKVRGQQDTSRQGRWHNATFRKTAEEMGLEHKGTKADSSHGYSFVTLTSQTLTEYADLIVELDREIRLVCHLPVWLGGAADEDDEKGGEKIGKAPQGEDEGKTKSGNVKATCECEEPNIIRLSRKVLDKRVVQCEECDSLFTESA